MIVDKKQRMQGQTQDTFVGLLHQPGLISQSLHNGIISDLNHDTLQTLLMLLAKRSYPSTDRQHPFILWEDLQNNEPDSTLIIRDFVLRPA